MTFLLQLEKAEDGFSIIAEYFGRGLFSQPAAAAAILPADLSKPLGNRRQVRLSHYLEAVFRIRIGSVLDPFS